MRNLIPPVLAGVLVLAACVDGAEPVDPGPGAGADPGDLAGAPIAVPTTTVPVARAGGRTTVTTGAGTRTLTAPPVTIVTTSPSMPVTEAPSGPVGDLPGSGEGAGAAGMLAPEWKYRAPCRAAGGDGECLFAPPAGEETPVWYPELQKEAFEAIDPRAAGADAWYKEEEAVRTAPHRFYRFYHLRGDEQLLMWESWRRTRNVFWDSPLIYYPVRYDLSWHDYPETVSVLATWPLGEQRELLVSDGAPLARIELPPGPPLPPTTPYADPVFPGTAHELGRDCPPVEHLWSRDAPVEDPCTLAAVRTALQYAYGASDPDQTRAAVRDGHVLGGTIGRIREMADRDPFFSYWFDPANPGHYLAEARNVRWAGRFPGASMISAEYRLHARPGLAPPRTQALARLEMQGLVESGADFPEGSLADELPTEPPPPEVGSWDGTLLVRTADGTWRVSYPMWCFSMGRKTIFESVRCPDDPNPVWSDSMWDFDLYPPNHLDFWLNATPDQRNYRGTPPS